MASETLAPDGVLDSLNYTSLVLADIDEDPASPDAAYGAWDGNGNTSGRVSFPTPTGNPSTGAGVQAFRVHFQRSGNASLGWSIQLWENGAEVSALATGTLASASTTITATWDAGLLGTASGALVECRLQQTSGGTGGGRQGIELGAVAWDVEYTIAPAEGFGVPALALGATGAGATVMSGFAVAALTLGLLGDGAVVMSGNGAPGLTLGAEGVGDAPSPEGFGSVALALGSEGVGAAVHYGDGSLGLTLGAEGEGDAPSQGGGNGNGKKVGYIAYQVAVICNTGF